jgi:UDP-glucose 4-epimerase
MSRKKILLTGGNGFIGKNILEVLGAKYEILSPGRLELDLLDQKAVFEYLKINRPEIILHAATAGGNRLNNDKPDILKNNLIIFFNLLAAKEHFDRMIIFGSGAEYDKRREINLVQEDDFGRCIPGDEYGLSKFTMAKIAAGSDFITQLRFFGVYGKYEDYKTRLISNLVCKALLDLPLALNQDAYFDYLYVNDAIKVIDKVIENKPKEVFYNVGSGQRINLLSIAGIILEIMEKKLPITVAKEGFNKEYTCDASKLKNEFPELVFSGLKENISKMIVYYRKNLPDLKE